MIAINFAVETDIITFVKPNNINSTIMIYFFDNNDTLYVLSSRNELNTSDKQKLSWLFGNASIINKVEGNYVGPRIEMITPWSTNAVEITQNMGIDGIERIEMFRKVHDDNVDIDEMQQSLFQNIDETIFDNDNAIASILYIEDIRKYNQQEGLALSEEEIQYLEEVSRKIGRKLTDSEVFGFSQVNSEHCRHKIFNGKFIIDGVEKEKSLFQLIKLTSATNKGKIVSAYKDNVAFIDGPEVEQFYPKNPDKADFFATKPIDTVISLKAETHNFPTTVEPFNGAATGSGGEIRDRLAGGKGSIPLAGTAVYMTSYPRLNEVEFKHKLKARPWLYQTPCQILIKASNGASDFGNKFGQPLICGSVLTFEHEENNVYYGYDKVIMLAGGVGFAKKSDSIKEHPQKGDKVIVMGGDNYRIGMGGGAVSSVDTGKYKSSIELNAVQRSNPEMQKRVYNAIRAMCEMDDNPIISVHDHGAGGHLNSLSELVEDQGGFIYLDKLPVGDKTLSAKEIIGNESQERMGLVISPDKVEIMSKVAQREKAPFYVVGEVTGDKNFSFVDRSNNTKPLDLPLEYLLGKTPQTVITDEEVTKTFDEITFSEDKFTDYLKNVLQLEAVACKDWLTNKVDRSVTGKVAIQQTAGPLQLPLNNLGVMALDYNGQKGVATSIGHAPIAGLIDPGVGSKLSLVESLTNIVWAPLIHGLKGISLSANWMWPCKNNGEDARLYKAVETISNFAIEVGVNIPTGKDSLSMTQKYSDDKKVFAPGTVIVSAVAEVSDINKVVQTPLKSISNTQLLYIDFCNCNFDIGGSAFAQTLNKVGTKAPNPTDTNYIVKCFNTVQQLINEELILSGHDVSAGGLITTLLEMTFSHNNLGLKINLNDFGLESTTQLLFSEKPAIVVQIKDVEKVTSILEQNNISFKTLGTVVLSDNVSITHNNKNIVLQISEYRDVWYSASHKMELLQADKDKANERKDNIFRQEREFIFPNNFTGKLSDYGLPISQSAKRPKAAIIREKGVNGDREMAWSLYLAGFDVKDVHMSDLMSGAETLEDINMIAFVGGFSNSDVLGSAKGWAGAFKYNEKANETIRNFYKRSDTLSLGVCNGCQLMTELNLITGIETDGPKMRDNESEKFESSFLTVTIPESPSVMLKTLQGTKLGVWVAHFEGRFDFSNSSDNFNIAVQYAFDKYPCNPNGSPYNTAAICSSDGRHLAIMPHLERAILPWQWACYSSDEKHQVTPWIEAFINARKWIENKI